MSRIDDGDRQSRRAAEQLAIRRRKEEERAKERQQAEGPFSKLLRRFHAPEPGASHSTPEADASGSVDTSPGGEPATSKLGGSAALKHGPRTLSADRQAVARPRSHDVRMEEAKETRTTRPGGGDARTSDISSAGTALRSDGDLRSDADGGDRRGSGGSGSGERDHPPAQPASGFHFNPALLAPIPVAKRKEGSRSEPLRALAAEIAQRIVDRVRVGTNAAGMAEFQIDLRSDVLRGLSIRISAGAGIIRASFSGTDREVLKLLRDNADGLQHALAARGLTLGELRIEERA